MGFASAMNISGPRTGVSLACFCTPTFLELFGKKKIVILFKHEPCVFRALQCVQVSMVANVETAYFRFYGYHSSQEFLFNRKL